MKLGFRDIEGFAKNPDPKALAVLIYGPDEGLVRERLKLLTKNVVSDPNDAFNVTDLTAGKVSDTPALLMDEAQSISMLGGRRVIRLRDASDKITAIIKDTLAALKAGDNLVLVEAGELGPRSSLRQLFEAAPNAAALPCYVDDEKDLSRVIADDLRNRGYKISGDALQHMASNITGDRMVARSEVEKLVTYMGPQKEIDIEDVMACVGNAAALPMDDIARHIASGKFAEGEKVLRYHLAEGESAVTILRNLQNYFAKLYTTRARLDKGESLDMAHKKIFPAIFFKNKSAFDAQVTGWTLRGLEQAQSLLMTVEARCKQTGADPDLLCSRALMSLAQMGNKALNSRRRA